MPGKGKNKKRGAPKQAAAQSQNPASDKETPSPDKNESNDPNDVQTGPAAPTFQPPKEEKQAKESKEGAAASEIKPESPVFDSTLALGKEHKTEETEGDSSLALKTSPIAKSTDKEEKTSAAAEPVVDVEVEDDKERDTAPEQSLDEAVGDQAGHSSDPTLGKVSKRVSEDGHDVDGDEGKQSKRPRVDQHIGIRMLLPSKFAGVVIGKRGENISRLRSDYKADVRITRNRGPECVLSIKGDASDICEAVSSVLSGISQQSNAINHEIRFLVNDNLANSLMLNGCRKMNDLRADTGAQIKLHVDYAPLSLERVIKISGTLNQIVSCIKAIHDTVEVVGSNGPIILYDPRNWNKYNTLGYGGYPEEPGQKGSKDSSSLAGGSAFNRLFAEVVLSKELTGAVVGKDASRIKQVEDESFAKISLDAVSPDSAERVICIVGTQKQIEYALYMLQVLIHQYAATA